MLAERLQSAHLKKPKPNILVIGDLMLDHYIFGSATRLSPEAPVPVVNVEREDRMIGGAANVASNLIDLGAHVYLAGLIGNDVAGEDIVSILQTKDIDTSRIIKDDQRSTTVKTRIIAANHQIVRIDREDITDISEPLENSFFDALLPCMDNSDMIILSDYNKGLLTPSLSHRIIEYCKRSGKQILVDPKGLDYEKYKGAFIIKPNRKELADAAKTDKIHTQDDLVHAARIVLELTEARYLIVTLSEAGIAIITHEDCTVLPVVATKVYDVTGAGDTVMATLAYGIALGFSVEEACALANYAASNVIKHIGSATTTVEEIVRAMKKQH